jgi:enoyl-CoA hydratase
MCPIQLDVDEGVATITIDSPATRNALNPELSRELADVCERVDGDSTVGAAVICGAGGTFCSGAERDLLSRNGEDPADPERYAEIGAIYDAFVRVGKLTVPTVAAARGAAVGAGVNLLLATDLRVVATDARIIAGFTRIGIHPGGGHFALLARLVGLEAAAAIGVFGEEISGARAAELGMAWAAVDADQVEETAHRLAAAAAKDPELARRVVGSMRRELGPPGVPRDVAVDFERGSQMWSLRRRDVGAVAQR